MLDQCQFQQVLKASVLGYGQEFSERPKEQGLHSQAGSGIRLRQRLATYQVHLWYRRNQGRRYGHENP